MKIFFLINSPYPRYAGGIETWLYNVSQRLCNEHDITIISHYNNCYPILFTNLSEKIKIYKFKTLNSYKLSSLLIRSYISLFDLFLGSYSMGYLLKKLIPKNKECYIIALDSMFCVKAGLIGKSSNKKVKLISSVRGPHAEILSKSFKLFSKCLLAFENKMLKQADCVWANGYDTIDSLKKKEIPSKLMKNGIDYINLCNLKLDQYESASLKKGKTSIVCVGSLLPIKGIYELISSVSILINEYHINVDLFFIGKGDKTPLIKFASKTNIDKNVHFLGHKDNPIKYIKEFTISACLSGGSGMSMAAIESMASGVPIIAWDSPVYQQFNKNNNTMLLVKNTDVTALTNGLIEIINNYNHYLSYAENAKKEAKNYDWSIICNDLLKNINDDC